MSSNNIGANNGYIAILFALYFFIMVLMYCSHILSEEVDKYKRSVLYDIDNLNKTLANGIYFSSDKYYCVWTEGRLKKFIETTEHHEICHDFVEKDWQHFCNNS